MRTRYNNKCVYCGLRFWTHDPFKTWHFLCVVKAWWDDLLGLR